MNLLTHAYLLEKYGLRLDMKQLADVLGIAENTVYNRIASGKLEIKTYTDGKSRYADIRDVVAYFDACRDKAA